MAIHGHAKHKNCAAPLKFKNLPCTQVDKVSVKYGLLGTKLTTTKLIPNIKIAK